MIYDNNSLIKNATEIINTTGNNNGFLNQIPFYDIFVFFFVPVILALTLFLCLKFMPDLKRFIKKKRADYGQIEIWFLMDNKRIKEKMISLNEFKNFTFKGGRYSLDKMSHFIIGYRNNIPVFFYDKNFILPLVIEKHKINDEIRKQYNKLGVKLTDNEISAISIKLEPTILELVYSKKLISDLYSVVKDDKMNKMLMWVLIIAVVVGLLYYTGILQQILGSVGIDITNHAVNVTNSSIRR